MLVKETNEFKVILENPWLELNSKCTEDNLQMNKYPKIFSRIYKFETGEEIVTGDNIWRIVSEGNFRRNIRCVKFSINHLLMDIFPSYESANLELDRTIDIESKNQDFHNLKQILLYISVLSNTKDFDKKSLAEIKLNLDNINSLSKKYGN